MMTTDTNLYDLHLHSESQLYEKSKTSLAIFLQMLKSILMKFSVLPQHVALLKLILHIFYMINIKGGELFLHSFIKYTFNIGLCKNTC